MGLKKGVFKKYKVEAKIKSKRKVKKFKRKFKLKLNLQAKRTITPHIYDTPSTSTFGKSHKKDNELN